jgi:alanine racemase
MPLNSIHQNSVIEVSRSAIRTNIEFLKSVYGSDVRFSSVVKANAYGHGIHQFVPVAETYGIDHFSVFSLEEAIRVKQAMKNHCDIMIMGWIDEADISIAVENDFEFYVFEIGTLKLAFEAAKKLDKKARIHLEIETGMNRTGLTDYALKQAVKFIKAQPQYITVRGLCTHYAGAESISNYLRIQNQIRNFNRTYKWILKRGIVPDILHTACSAASIAYPKTQMDMVRIGILQYGFWPSAENFIHFTHSGHVKSDPLQRVLSWKSKVMSVKKVKEGEFVSYGTTYLAKDDMTVAIIPTGYSQGYSRSLSNQGRVLIHGQRVGVVGIINMNMLIIDVTGMEEVDVGDEVVLIGKQGDLEITVASFTEISDQLNYELLARLPMNIPRIVVD